MAEKRRLQYTIGVNADTTLFRLDVLLAILALLQVGLKTLITSELKTASLAALELQANLARAFNQNTGKLDLLTFSKNLKQSGQTLDAYYNLIIKLGPAGELAFLKVALAITQSELPLKRSNKLLSDLWTTMKNTMRWQITSGALNTFTGALKTAYGYSRDLDRSLNSIRIITNKNIDDMREFADLANEAAKALSTTTVDYTDASLIYYQLGLNDLQVLERTETTIKLANVSNLVAEDVSSLMTAIWLNFYDGSKSLEYYADVITALGATTASSSDLIALGVLKFAPIANTVGLSYEYAATALATLVANTQLSADIVGTSLRTLFSRLQGLKLGETLDDGTDLNKYSLALNTVGVNIKDANGELKDMDTILDETAKKWGTLSKDQLMALALTVAGVRQYTSFIALMDSWGDFLQNLNTALGSEGTLQKQANIYAESWKAARDNVRASAEDIYNSLINPLLYIQIDKTISPILDITADIVDGLGGLPGILTVVGNLMLFAFNDKIASSMRDMAENISILTGHENQNLQFLKEQSLTYLEEQRIVNEGNAVFLQKLDLMLKQTEFSIEEAKITEKMTESEQEATLALRMNVLLLQLGADAALKRAEAAQKSTKSFEEQLQDLIFFDKGPKDVGRKELVETFSAMGVRTSGKSTFEIKALGFETVKDSFKETIELLERLRAFLRTYASELKGAPLQALREYAQSLGLTDSQIERILKHSDLMSNSYKLLETSNQQLTSNIDILREKLGLTKEQVERLEELFRAEARATIESGLAAALATEGYDAYLLKLRQILNEAPSVSEEIVAIALALMAVTSFNNAFNNITDALTDDSLTGLEKFNKLLGSAIALLPVYINLLKNTNLLKSLAAVKATYLDGANQAVAASGAAAAGGMTAFAGGIKAVAISMKELLTAIPIIGIAVAALSVLANVYSTVTNKIKELLLAAREASYEEADNILKLIEDNNKLIKSMNETLLAYKENGENKKELDDITSLLAEKFNIEGSALASLTGKYDDYNSVLEKATELLKELLKDAINRNNLAKYSAGQEVMTTAREGKGFSLFGVGRYSARFEGLNKEERKILQKNVSSDITGITGDNLFLLLFDVNDIDSYIKAYNLLTDARNELLETLTPEELQNNYLLGLLNEYLNRLQEIVDKYVGFALNEAIANILLNNSGNDVSSLKEYQKWASEVEETLREAGIEGQKLDSSIKYIVDSSLNTLLSDFYKLDKVASDIKSKVTSWFTKDIDLLVSDDAFDNNVLAVIKWGSVTDKNFSQMYENAKKYTDAVKENELAVKTLTEAESALEIIKKAKGSFDADNLTKISNAINWGDEKENIIEFTEFLKMTLLDLIDYLNKIVSNSYKNSVESINNEILATKDGIAILQSEYNNFNDDRTLQAKYELLQEQELYNAIMAYRLGLYNKDDFNLDESRLATFDTFKKFASTDEIEEELEKRVLEAKEKLTEATKLDIQVKLDKEQALKEQRSLLEELEEKAIITVKLNFDRQVSDIENSTSKIADIFDAISKGIEKTTDETGKAVYGINLEAAKAIEELYPGFMANAKLLRDGSFAMSEEMYQAFYDSEKGILAVDSQTKAGQLLNIITILEEKKKSALSSLELATKLATGELAIEDLTLTLQLQLYSDFIDGKKTENGEFLKDEVDKLTTSDANWSNLYDDITAYSKDAAEKMSGNISTATGLVLQNLEKIRDGAYKAATLISEIGSKTISTNLKIDTEAIVATKDTSWLTEIDKRTSEIYKAAEKLVTDEDLLNFATYDDAVKSHMFTAIEREINRNKEDLALYDGDATSYKDTSKLLGEELTKYYQDYINLLDTLISAAKTAQSILLGAIDDAYDKLKKTEKSDATKLKDDKQIERYHYINRLLEERKKLLDEIDEQASRTYGQDRINLYTKKQEELNSLITELYQKLAEALKYLESDKTATEEFFKTYTNKLIKFENGHIINYRELEEYLVGEYNLIANGEDKQATETLRWRMTKGLELLKLLEDTADTEKEINKEFLNTQRQFKDLDLEKINHTLDVALDSKSLRDNLRGWQKSLKEATSDALFQGFDLGELAIKQFTDDANILYAYINKYNYLVTEFKNAVDGVTDKNALREQMIDLLEKIISTGENLLEFVDTMENLLPNAVSAAAERFAQFTSQLDHNVSILSAVKELLSLLGVTYKTADGFKTLNDVLQSLMDSLSAAAELNKKQYENWRQLLLEAEAALALLTEGGIAYDLAKMERDAILELYNESLQAMLQSALDVMNTAKEMFTMAVEEASYQFEKSISDGLSFDLMQDKFDHYIEEEERYFDKVNELYLVNAWNNKLLLDIDNTTNKAHIDRLKALLDEIDLRREGNTLSQYDLDVLEAKYNLLLAEMALEDALNAKNSLRLVRDKQGNWNYLYTADLGEIDKAQDQFMKAQNDWYNISKKLVKTLSGDILKTYLDFNNAVKDVYNDQVLSDLQKAEKIIEIENYYTEKIKFLENEKNIAVKDMTEAGKLTIEDFSNSYAGTLDNLDGETERFKEYAENYINTCEKAFNDYADTVENKSNDMSLALGDLGLNLILQDINESNIKLKDSGVDAIDAIHDEIDKILTITSAYRDMADAILRALNLTSEYALHFTSLGILMGGEPDKSTLDIIDKYGSNVDYSALMAYAWWYDGRNAHGYNILSEARENKIDKTGITPDISTDELLSYFSWNSLKSDEEISAKADELIENYAESNSLSLDEARRKLAELYWKMIEDGYIAKYETGGYTGEFNSGRLAILHEKELVLNKEDTLNILNAVSAIRMLGPEFFRGIETVLDNDAVALKGFFGSLLDNYKTINPVDGTLLQDVHIEAHFPNATDRNEIEEAFKSLNAGAAQWARRNRGD